jgi:hypothetical protein
MTRKKEVIVVSSANQDRLSWLPLYPAIKTVAPVKIKRNEKLSLDFYFKTIEECTYYIHDFNLSYVETLTYPKSAFHERYYFTEGARKGYSLQYITDLRIENVAEQLIGGIFRFRIDYGRLDILHEGSTFVSGPILFLPPPTKISAEQAIDLIVNALTGAETKEFPPAWEDIVDLPGLNTINEKIQQKENRIPSSYAQQTKQPPYSRLCQFHK